jgi:hypothetical protein
MPSRVRYLGSVLSAKVWVRINNSRALMGLLPYPPSPKCVTCGPAPKVPFGSLDGCSATFGNLGGTEGTSIATTY